MTRPRKSGFKPGISRRLSRRTSYRLSAEAAGTELSQSTKGNRLIPRCGQRAVILNMLSVGLDSNLRLVYRSFGPNLTNLDLGLKNEYNRSAQIDILKTKPNQNKRKQKAKQNKTKAKQNRKGAVVDVIVAGVYDLSTRPCAWHHRVCVWTFCFSVLGSLWLDEIARLICSFHLSVTRVNV